MAVDRQQDPEAYEFGNEKHHQYLAELRKDLLTFGQHFATAQGASYYLDSLGKPDTQQGIHTWISSRMAHVYTLDEIEGHSASASLVDAALAGLTGLLHDDAHGGWYSSIDAHGIPQQRKVCYAHAFVILAATSTTLTSHQGARKLLDESVNIFMEHFWDDTQGLTVDSWNEDFTQADSYRGLNANMHTVEAFLALADVLHQEEWRRRAGRIITRVLAWAEHNQWRIPEHFTSEWEPLLEFNNDKRDDQFKPYGATPGHGIEWSRLITQYALSAESIPSRERDRLIILARQLFGTALHDAWASARGNHQGLSYTTDWQGNTVVGDRMHWTLAEAVNAAATLYTVTGDEEYADWYRVFWQFIDEYLVDHVNGSWFHQLNAENQVIATVWKGKPDLYHAVQATLIPQLSPSMSVASALKAQLESISL
ncbi:AGE family epimerase/isomerase [Bifidobacterium sp.]|jgi:mannose/cellobiose epimerase-like protein (N-acyl-D-glucosamine 2-epimerase family)|uniref:AGE family epimerase/isomerase n=1 Tax=Bifidobacterium sp. TaxID=41200 RepID=UPI0025BA90D0|nr:AGE family epimerase/isomerase [Bifidobacterium sp.]MCI1635413.1 AGE family epimerase/isomerase [Bifidobacterium sp.]